MTFLLYSGLWIAAAIATAVIARGLTATKARYAALLVAVFTLLFSAYCIGQFDGRGRYYASLREELSPFLQDLNVASGEKKKEAVSDFFLGAEEIKTTPEEYLASLKHAHGILKKPNQHLRATVQGKSGGE